MVKKYEIHVISNTHWDREWLYNFQETHLMLVEMIDSLLDIFDMTQTINRMSWTLKQSINQSRKSRHRRDDRLVK